MEEVNEEILREGLEEVLRILEDIWRTVVGEPDIPLACALCYSMINECKCEVAAPWPLPLVIYKLKGEIGSAEWN